MVKRALIGFVAGLLFAAVLVFSLQHRAGISDAVSGAIGIAAASLHIRPRHAFSAKMQFIYWSLAGILVALPPKTWQRVTVAVFCFLGPVIIFVIALARFR
jgi:hypothetical protein